MAIVALPQSESLDDSEGGIVSWPYRVIENDPTQTLLLIDAYNAAITQATSDVGIPPFSAPVRERRSKNEFIVDLRFALPVYQDYVAFKAANPGGTYTEKIIEEATARILPPGPIELKEAHEIIQKVPAVLENSLVLDDVKQVGVPTRKQVPIYPPKENLSRRFTVPASLLTSTFFSSLSRIAHKLNSDTVTTKGVTYAPGELMLLSASLQTGGLGSGVLQLGFATGEPLEVTFTYLNDSDVATSGTLTGVLPFSRVTYFGELQEANKAIPAKIIKYGAYEHRVWPETPYAGILPA